MRGIRFAMDFLMFSVVIIPVMILRELVFQASEVYNDIADNFNLTFLEVCPDLHQIVSLAMILMKMSQSVAKVYKGMIARLS